jgi:enamine deaminase RidA (YjgF/YER057c/UK114 family)
MQRSWGRSAPSASSSRRTTIPADREAALRRAADEVGFDLDAEFQVGGHYVPFVIDGRRVHVSGQISRVSGSVVLTGRAGDVPLERAQLAAKVSAVRALAVLRHAAGGLDRIAAIPHVAVFTQCTATFTQQSEVADGASDLLAAVLGEAGRHTRTSIGVYQLPKDATVELELVATLTP